MISRFLPTSLLALALLGANAAHAELIATPLPGDTRLVQFSFDPNNTYQVLARPKAISDIELQAGEKVMGMAVGDSFSWDCETSVPGHIFVRPKIDGTVTSATVVTDRRTYQLMLRSTAADNGKWYQRITWDYPSGAMVQLVGQQGAANAAAAAAKPAAKDPLHDGVSVDQLNFAYSISGNAPFKPTQVVDDGTFTWIQLPANLQDYPAVFMVTPDNRYSALEPIVSGNYLKVTRVMPKMLLKIGSQEVEIKNNKLQ